MSGYSKQFCTRPSDMMMDQRKTTVENGPLLPQCSAPRVRGQKEKGQNKKPLNTRKQPQIPVMKFYMKNKAAVTDRSISRALRLGRRDKKPTEGQ